MLQQHVANIYFDSKLLKIILYIFLRKRRFYLIWLFFHFTLMLQQHVANINFCSKLLKIYYFFKENCGFI